MTKRNYILGLLMAATLTTGCTAWSGEQISQASTCREITVQQYLGYLKDNTKRDFCPEPNRVTWRPCIENEDGSRDSGTVCQTGSHYQPLCCTPQLGAIRTSKYLL